jgi:glucan-binding YG repeat protein
VTGWLLNNRNWYYLYEDHNLPDGKRIGCMAKGWLELEDGIYYLRPVANTPSAGMAGSMVTGSQIISGVVYNFGPDGRLIQ